MTNRFLIFFLLLSVTFQLSSQSLSLDKHWLNSKRQIRYLPDGEDFVIVNGNHRFNRALYGTNTGFRVEAGDLPEFAMYMPRFGGNLHVGIIKGDKSKWLTASDCIEARYRAGSMIYSIRDSLLGDGTLKLIVLALADGEGMIIKIEADKPLNDVDLVWAFGGATDKRFRREGDLNADPETVFDLTPDNCKGNEYAIFKNTFTLQYGAGQSLTLSERFLSGKSNGDVKRLIYGVLSSNARAFVADANALSSPVNLLASSSSETPVLAARQKISGKASYILLKVPASSGDTSIRYDALPSIFANAENARAILASRVKISTPDAYINTLGPTLAVAADAIWEYPTYMHGAIGWRMRLNGWRGPYVADPLGWHDRAQSHFSSYAQSQITEPASGPSVPDPDKNLARQQEKMGNALFTSGYICRNPNGDFKPHHYDMNLVFIDALLRHFRWTGDTAFARQMWPVITRHLDWEKRNFDADNDGLYDAYACIWASDALEYSGGGVTHSSAYNYWANKTAAQLAKCIGQQGDIYQHEADKILQAIQSQLWLPNKGWFAEYKDWNGMKRTHDAAAAIWTIYHALDSEVASPFQAWQASRYIETGLPHIPLTIDSTKPENRYFLHSTTNWQPYDWSLNNVVMAENLHASLAHWQAGRNEAAFQLFKSSLLDAMFMGSSPGNFVQLSALDAARGEMYRDFADEIGMTARSLVEGLFGIHPDAINGQLVIKPGFPDDWDYASLEIPDFKYSYRRRGSIETFDLQPQLDQKLNLIFRVNAKTERLKKITVNGLSVHYQIDEASIGRPVVVVDCGIADRYLIDIEWMGDSLECETALMRIALNDSVSLVTSKASFGDVYDPQNVLSSDLIDAHKLSGTIKCEKGNHSFFVKMAQGDFSWWRPVCVEVVDLLGIIAKKNQPADTICFQVQNNLSSHINLQVKMGQQLLVPSISIEGGQLSDMICISDKSLIAGTNRIDFWSEGKCIAHEDVVNWGIISKPLLQQPIKLTPFFNADVSKIFEQAYLSPRWPYPTLQLPKQGVGNWCYPNIHPQIDDSGVRAKAKSVGYLTGPQGITFQTPSEAGVSNIAFASLWDNYPDSVVVPLAGNGRHLYLLMAGTTNPMQSRIDNGIIRVDYTDGTSEILPLVNPDNWAPIEQDYFQDGYAFYHQQPVSPRLLLKTGELANDSLQYKTIDGYSNRIIDGGAATILDLPLNPKKKLKSITVKALANDVVIGLMAVTIVM